MQRPNTQKHSLESALAGEFPAGMSNPGAPAPEVMGDIYQAIAHPAAMQLASPTAEQESVPAYVDALFAKALQQRASDLHLEPQRNGLRIRLRVDGILHDLPTPPTEIALRLCARIKVMAKLDIAERRLPQDGRISVPGQHQRIDLRVSSLPTLWGEKLVLRIVPETSAILPLEALGLSEQQRHVFATALSQPQGLILVTGPTGSGKTLTLYSALQTLNADYRNISTAEEPVEIPLPGINQVGIAPHIGLDFGATLRALLRQDPDVLMVGEIRDEDTAAMAIRAAQTGHLVLSTLHTKSAITTLARLRQLGISDRDVLESVTLIVAQRLLRKLCDRCKLPTTLSWHAATPDLNAQTQSFKANPDGCHHCLQGYRGRMGVFELCSPAMLNGPDEHASKDTTVRPPGSSQKASDTAEIAGSAPTPYQDLRAMGLQHYAQGLTCLTEVDRVLPQQSFESGDATAVNSAVLAPFDLSRTNVRAPWPDGFTLNSNYDCDQ